tara:strand:- start:433 stop:609 length:177 start_codon:yes stop_codon:yes gene_type:complete
MRLISYFRGPRAKDSELLLELLPVSMTRAAASRIRGPAGAAAGAHTIQRGPWGVVQQH